MCSLSHIYVQAESILPSSLGETMRTVRDEAFFDIQALKRRVLPKGIIFEICDVCNNVVLYNILGE